MSPRAPQRPSRLGPAVLLGTGLLLSGLAGWQQQRHNADYAQEQFNQQARQVTETLVERIRIYEYGLRGTRGAVLAAGEWDISLQRMRVYGASRDIAHEFPGARGYGFIRRVPAEALPRLLERLRRERGPDLRIRQLGPQVEPQAIIEYIEPEPPNSAAIGLDIASEPHRAEAARQAARTGLATLTAPITLVQTRGQEQQSFLFLLPIYRPGAVLDSPQAREAATLGWAYAPLSVPDILRSVNWTGSQFALTLNDLGPHGQMAFYRAGQPDPHTPLLRSELRPVFGRRWRIDLAAGPGFTQQLNLLPPWIVLGTGVLLTLPLSVVALGVQRSRQRQAVTRALQARLVTLIDNSSDAIIGETPDGRIVSWNRAAEQIFGYRESEVLGLHAATLIEPADGQAQQTRRREQVIAGKQLSAFDTQCRRRDGQWVDVSITMSAVTDAEGHVVGLGKTIRDIRDRKAAERGLREFSAQLETEVQERTAQLEAARHDLQTILDAVPSMIGYWDRDLRNRFANHAYHRWFGVDPGSLPGRHLKDLLGPVLFEQNLPMVQAALRGEPQTFERAIPRPDGTGDFHSLAHYLPDEQDGEVRGFYVLVHDVTELTQNRLKLAQLVRENEALLSTIKSHALYSVTDRSGRIIDVNEGFCRISGYPREELLGQNHRLINSGTHDSAFWKTMWATVTSGQAWHGEVCNRTKDGQLYWVDSIIAPFIGAQGRIERFISIRFDITERKRAERRLAESEAFLERTGQLAGVGGWQFELSTGTLTWTEQVRRIHGAPPDYQPSLSTALDFYPPQARQAIAQAVQEAQETGRSWDLELPLNTMDGRAIWVRAVGEPERPAGQPDAPPLRLIGALQDVTARREADQALLRLEAAEAASAAKTAFLANMSHEIRTPMNAVIGLAYLLEQTELDEEQRSCLTKIQLASRALLGVINDVLDVSKIEAGEMTLDEAPFDLDALLHDLGEWMAPQAEDKGLVMALQADPEVPRRLRGDVQRIRQIFTNLLGNALKFTEQGRIDLHIGCPEHGPERALLRCEVSDTGIGIDEASQSRLFSPFTQADASTTRRFGGSGLGLSIVRHLASLMGGEVGVHSRIGSGSTFWVTLPLKLAGADSAEADGSPIQTLEVLIADDLGTDRNVLTAMARSLGWRTEAVESGQHLHQRLHERLSVHQPPDALVADLHLSDADALSVLARLRDEFGREQLPPAVILSAQTPLPDSDLADSLISKPVTHSSLFNAVNTAVARRSGRCDKVLQSTRLQGVGAQWLPGMRVLVVDDSDINLEVARRILEREGAKVMACGNGREALERLRQQPEGFDAVLMDVQMPEMDGNEATRRLRGELGLTQLPVIALTAGALVAERQRALESGMTDFISKPLDPQALIRTLRRRVEAQRGEPWPVEQRATSDAAPPPNWPRLEEVDTRDAAERLGPDPAVFLRMLGRLLEEYEDLQTVPADLHAARPPDRPLSARLHKLRGSAGMLGAKVVQRLAGDAETLARAGAEADQMRTALQALAQALQRLRRQARDWLDGQRLEDDRHLRQQGPQPTVALEALQAWAAMLEAQDLAALDRFRELAPALQQHLPTEAFATLRDAVEHLSFAQAAVLVNRLVEAARRPADAPTNENA
ncbi:PAS domain S-box protein [Ideonella sp. B7]|uniref:CHASE domain-containing hybrid sensor histidine kinase/response regulator n=1 Tax=Ideonella benzenivorans TaxID=2831643 RepID=UPI001CEC2423|nr:PAS domain S-box protein [Ideonella benzenivorans]MCA6218858.1 PAS domain S-box protein [Ideonella benzenivorans]